MNFAKFLGTTFLIKNLRWLLLKGRSAFQTKGFKERERKRDLKSTAVDRNNITISYINAIKYKRPFYVSDNLSDASPDYPANAFLRS